MIFQRKKKYLKISYVNGTGAVKIVMTQLYWTVYVCLYYTWVCLYKLVAEPLIAFQKCFASDTYSYLHAMQIQKENLFA